MQDGGGGGGGWGTNERYAVCSRSGCILQIYRWTFVCWLVLAAAPLSCVRVRASSPLCCTTMPTVLDPMMMQVRVNGEFVTGNSKKKHQIVRHWCCVFVFQIPPLTFSAPMSPNLPILTVPKNRSSKTFLFFLGSTTALQNADKKVALSTRRKIFATTNTS